MKKTLLLALLVLQHLPTPLQAQIFSEKWTGASHGAQVEETQEQRDARMQWFRDGKFGMFIHWGVYAVPAGFYRGEKIKVGTAEWIMNYGRIPVADYRALARQFNPVQYSPADWMALAKEAGMKYVVITAKHHDGFALFDSKVSDWNVVQATPYGKDLIAPLAEAARSEGLKLGLYYSQALDWGHPGGGGCKMTLLPSGKYVKDGGKWDPAQEGDFDEYLRKVSLPQVAELVNLYRPDMIWWDYPQDMTTERAKPFDDLLRSHPEIITNGRLGGGYSGDMGNHEQHVPGQAEKGDWEACMTLNDTWGFRSDDHNWKSSDQIIHTLIDAVSRGGNFLLNVGPTAEGIIPPESVERLKKVGAWLKINGESIYATRVLPPCQEGTVSYTRGKDGQFGYAICKEWPGKQLVLKGIQASPESKITMLGFEKPLVWKQDAERLTIDIPDELQDPKARPCEHAWAFKIQMASK